MLLPGKRIKRKEPPTVLRTRDKLLIVGFFAVFLGVGAFNVWRHNARYHSGAPAVPRVPPERRQEVKALDAEHRRIYPQLKQHAEEARARWKTLRTAEGAATPGTAAALAETNALREALWTEEFRYCRAVSALMPPADAQRYLAPLEKRFAERKPDAAGLLNLPHE